MMRNETVSESPIITFVRGTTLLALLIALPGIAVCWNHLPKNLWGESALNLATPKAEKTQYFRENSGDSELARSVSVFAPESVYSALPEMPAPEARAEILPKIQTEFQEESIPAQNPRIPQDTVIQQVSWEHSHTKPAQDFTSLGMHLEALGATYYKVEKWGNRGELFRVSCFVALAENNTHAKHFQAIGSDVVAVMQTVITDIERWKNMW